MQIVRTHKFKKQYQKLPKKMQTRFDERLVLWLVNPADSLLRVHSLTGNYTGYFSMNVTGDIRAVYRHEGDEIVIFALIGSHSELY